MGEQDELAKVWGELKAYREHYGQAVASLRSIQASRSWQLTAWLRSAAKFLRRPCVRLPDLHAGATVKPDERAGGAAAPGTCWFAESSEPQFVAPTLPVQGWIRIQADIRAPVPSRAALYFDSGALFNEGERFDLGPVGDDPGGRTVPVGSHRSAPAVEGREAAPIDLLVHLPRPAFAFRLDPLRAHGAFELRHFRITPLSGLEVDARSLLRRIRRAREGGPLWTSVRNCALMLLTGRWGEVRGKLRAVLGAGAVGPGDYARWRERRALTPARRDAYRTQASAAPPLTLSVLLPVYNTPEPLLRAAIGSVLRQTYPHWELCIADDASDDPHVAGVLAEYAAKDPRIKTMRRAENGHIAAASNAALALATGDYIALLDHDDELAEHALSAVAAEIRADPAVDMIYSDEDKLTPAGEHVDPFFKPDWSPEYFLACMYTCHLGVYRTSLVREVGGFRSEFDQAQDYDLVLRLSRRTQRIRHIPDILYHWRVTPGSTAAGADEKPLAHTRAAAALRDHLSALGLSGEVTDGPAAGFHRVRYDLAVRPRVTVVIPSACREVEIDGRPAHWAIRCVESLRRRATYRDLEIIVMGPPPADTDPAFEAHLSRLRVTRGTYAQPFNFSQACNAGAALGTGGVLLFLNDDTEVLTPGFVEEMLGFAQQEQIGAVGCRLLFPDGMLQHVGVTVLSGNPGHPFHHFPADHPGHFYSARVHRNWSAVTAACIMIRRDVYDEVGGFDESFPMNYNDVDLCLRIRATGRRIVYTPYAELVHHESVSKDGTHRHEVKQFHGRWLARFPIDPYYNINLSPTYGDFRVEA